MERKAHGSSAICTDAHRKPLLSTLLPPLGGLSDSLMKILPTEVGCLSSKLPVVGEGAGDGVAEEEDDAGRWCKVYKTPRCHHEGLGVHPVTQILIPGASVPCQPGS